MAKTNRRPVDRLERQQRLAVRNPDNLEVRRVNTRNWEAFSDDNEDLGDEQTVDQAEAA